MEQENLSVGNISDEYIRKFSKNRFILNNKDFNLRSGSTNPDDLDLYPVTGGLYDGKMFGSLYPRRCNCGLVKVVGSYCPSCGVTILNDAQRFTRYAVIGTPVYYSNPIRKGIIKSLIMENFPVVRYDLNNSNMLFTGGKRGGLDWESILDLAQFNVTREGGDLILIVTDQLTDPKYISLEGVLKIFEEYKPTVVDKLLTLMNRLIPVTPIALRPVRLNMFNGMKKLEVHNHTIIYRTIIHMCNEYTKAILNMDNIFEETLLKGTLRNFIAAQLYNMSEITNTSKTNFFRTTHSHRVASSGRAVIIPDTSLRIDEVGIPLFSAYEMYKSEFIAYIADAYTLDNRNEAIQLYISASDDIIDLFYEFVAERDKQVLVNRNPTLHKYNIVCCKVVLVKDSVIHLPQLLCPLMGADFDGDEVNFFAVPEELSEYCKFHSSPKHMVYYEKDHEFMFVLNHEALNGLIITSKFNLGESPLEFVSMIDIETAFNNAEIEVDTHIQFNDKATCYGRLKLSEILEADIDALLGDNVAVNGKNVSEIYALLAKYDPDSRASIIQKLQEFVLEMIYLSGETTLRLEEIYAGTDQEFISKIRAISESPELSNEEKMINIEDAHKAYIRNYLNSMDEKVKLRVSESSRMKIGALTEMMTPQMITNNDGSQTVSESSLLDGFTEKDMKTMSANNRKLLTLKFEAVSTSGFLTRQLSTIGQSLILINGVDEDNVGIQLPANRCAGRTTIEGTIVPKNSSSESIWVRSIISSDHNYLTPDLISNLTRITYDDKGVDHKGQSYMTSLTESTTQRGLSLKHGGALRLVLDEGHFYAPSKCTMELFDNYFQLTSSDGKVSKYPRTKSMVFMNKTDFEFGDLVCQLTKLNTFSYVLDCVIKMTRSIGRVSLPDVKNVIDFVRCINTQEGSSTIEYNFEKGTVKIGSEILPIRENTIYFFPDGDTVEFAEKFCSGLENIGNLMSKLLYSEVYHVFRSQFRFLMPNITEEIIESLFYIITDKANNSFNGVLRSNLGNKSLVPNIAFGYASKAITRAALGQSSIVDDPYTSPIINPFLVSDMMQEVNQ